MMRLLPLRVVLVATDVDDSSLPAIEAGRDLAAAAGADLHIVNVAGTSTVNTTGVHGLLERAGIGSDEALVHVVAGDPSLAIGRLADLIAADVIVLGPHHEKRDVSGNGALSADTAAGVVTNSAAPCLVAHRLQLPLERVVVAFDLSETSRGALIVGLSWASALRGRRARSGNAVNVTALYVTDPKASTDHLSLVADAIDRQLDELRESAGSWTNVIIESDMIAGVDVAESVAHYAAEHSAGLIVMGTRGLGIDSIGRIGSVAATVARQTDLPTLLVPPAIWLELGQVWPHRRARSS